MDNIFWLAPAVRFEDQLPYASTMHLETTLCPRNPKHAAKSRWPRPLKVIGAVNAMTDFEWTVYGDVLVSNEIANAIRQAGLSGVEFQSVELFTTTETPIGRDAFEMRVEGWGGIARPDSGVRVVEQCPFCNRRVFSEYTSPEKLFDIECWDGSDFFVIWPLPRYIMVTGSVRSHILREDYSGVIVRPLKHLPKGMPGTLTPGSVKDWFEGERARRIEGEIESEYLRR